MLHRTLTVVAVVGVIAGALGPRAGGYTLREDWLPPGSDFGGIESELPTPTAKPGSDDMVLWVLGELLFNSPAVFGERARRAGITCHACHLNGHINPKVFISRLSDRPGKIDVTNGWFNPAADDGVFNPVRIPSLRGIARTAPYGHKGERPDLAAFTRHVIVEEFGGAEPAGWMIDALVAFQRSIEFLPNAWLTSDGRLTDRATPDARRGEALFFRPALGGAGPSCAACHPPTQAFTDRRSHDVGSGGAGDTPTLRGLNQAPLYFHDGRFATLGDVVEYFDRWFGLGLDADERGDLVAYLEAIGDGEPATASPRIEADLDRIARFAAALDGLIERGEVAGIGLAVEAILEQLGQIDRRLQGAAVEQARGQLIDMARSLRMIEEGMVSGDPAGTRAALTTWRQGLIDRRASLVAASQNSLYPAGR